MVIYSSFLPKNDADKHSNQLYDFLGRIGKRACSRILYHVGVFNPHCADFGYHDFGSSAMVLLRSRI